MRKLAAIVTSMVITMTLTVIDGTRSKQSAVAKAATTASKRNRAMHYALSQKGCWYHYSRSGPCSHGYDCSGLVYRAYSKVGIWLPRTTGGMLRSSKLRTTTHPHWGDLAFFGSGHVELYSSGTKYNGISFGAHHSGTRVGYRRYNKYYHPTVFKHVVGAG